MLRVILIAALIVGSWLSMMLIHELGHVLGAVATGASVQKLVWHISSFSRTDVSPNPSPMVVVWAGPLIGSTFPLLIWLMVHGAKRKWAFPLAFFAGFCLLANGLYVGVGAVDPVGDAREMIRYGTPRGLMLLFGVLATTGGFCLLHVASHSLGFGKSGEPPSPQVQRVAIAVSAALVLLNLAMNLRD